MSAVRILIAFALLVVASTGQMNAAVSCVLTPDASLWTDGVLPNATWVATEFPLDVASTLSENTTRITLTTITHASDNTTYNATLNFGPSSNATATYTTGYALANFFSAMVQNASNTQFLDSYNALLLKYAITNVTVRSIDTTTIAPPPTTTTRAATTTAAGNSTTLNTTTLVTTSVTAPTLTPLPTNTDPSNSNTTYNNVDDGSDSNGGLIYAIIFGIIGGILLIGCITWAVKTFVMREKKDHSKRGGGYKYATSRAQHN